MSSCTDPCESKTTSLPSGDVSADAMALEVWMSSTGWPRASPLAGSIASRSREYVSSEATYATRRPSRERPNPPTSRAGSVRGSGAPRVLPVFSSIGTRHRFIEPSRFERK